MVMNPLQNNDSFEQWEIEGSANADEVGRKAAKEMIENYVQPPMPSDQTGSLSEFVAKRTAEYQSKSNA